MNKKIHFEEFKYNNIESFQFLQVPRVLLTNDYFKDLSIDAIMLYTLLLDTYKLSTKNNWRDEEGKVYIKFSIKRIEEFLRCKTDKAIKVLKELDEKGGIGLIHIKKQGAGLPNLIYVNNFNSKDLFDESSLKDYEGKDLNNLESTRENRLLGKTDYSVKTSRVLGKTESEPLGKTDPSNNKLSNTNSNNEYTSTSAIPYKEIIEYLNQKAGKTYKHTAYKNQSLIQARWNEGNRLDDFKKVIDIKSSEWLGDEKMNRYLRPSTLFGNKFDEYRNQSNAGDSDVTFAQKAMQERAKRIKEYQSQKKGSSDDDYYESFAEKARRERLKRMEELRERQELKEK